MERPSTQGGESNYEQQKDAEQSEQGSSHTDGRIMNYFDQSLQGPERIILSVPAHLIGD